MSRKKIDELFQEKFLDFKEAPDEKVWASIEASLDKKKKNRVIPLWWKLGGIAAVLFIGLIMFNPFKTADTIDGVITDVEQKDKKIDENVTDPAKEIDFKTEKETIIVTSEKDKEEVLNLDEDTTRIVNGSEKTKEQINLNTDQNAEKTKINGKNQWSLKKEALVQSKSNTSTKIEGAEEKNQEEMNLNEIASENTKIAANQTEAQLGKVKNNDKEDAPNDMDTPVKTTNNIPSGTTRDMAIAENTDVETKKTENDAEVTLSAATQEEAVTGSNEEKKSIFDEVKNQEEAIVAQKTSKKWSAGPSIAPVYFNAIGEGSSVHSIFISNSKSGNINLSYGLSVAYEVSPKLTVRSGIHKVDYGYDTNDVSFSTSLTALTSGGQIDNIDYNTDSKSVVVSSKTGGETAEQFNKNSLDVTARNAERDGSMSQQLGYLEVPLELNYALVNKKIGVNLIGGMSSLFLVGNAVALNSGDLTTEVGEANNINSLNFSANMGLGVNYKFSQNVRLNIEPVFKYQLNTFSETDGTFRPYSVGVYSGLSFQF